MSGLLERDVLVVNQKPKLIEMTNEYRILDEDGTEVGVVREEGQSKAKKALRLFTKVDQFLTHRLAVYDADGSKVLEIVRPAKILKSTRPGSGRRRCRAGQDRSGQRDRQEALRPAGPRRASRSVPSTARAGPRGTS